MIRWDYPLPRIACAVVLGAALLLRRHTAGAVLAVAGIALLTASTRPSTSASTAPGSGAGGLSPAGPGSQAAATACRSARSRALQSRPPFVQQGATGARGAHPPHAARAAPRRPCWLEGGWHACGMALGP